MKKIKKTLSLLIIIFIVGTIMFFIGRKIGLNTDTSIENTTVEKVTVGTQSIKKTLTSSGEVKSSEIEKLELSTSYYFETMCVETDDTIKKGDNILKYTNGKYLKAPYDCIISSYSVPETKTKATSSNYVEIQNLKDLIVGVSINENEIANISLNQEVEISLTADSSKSYTGKIVKIDSIGSYQTSGTTFNVDISLENDGNIKIGMSVSCTINIKELKDVIAVPINGVQINGNRRYVLVCDGESTKEVDITTGLSNDEYVQVLSGLNGGETIQVVTITKQNTIRNNTNGGSKFNNFSDGNMPNRGGSEMPNFGNGGNSSQGRNGQ